MVVMESKGLCQFKFEEEERSVLKDNILLLYDLIAHMNKNDCDYVISATYPIRYNVKDLQKVIVVLEDLKTCYELIKEK